MVVNLVKNLEIPEPIKCDIENLGGVQALLKDMPEKNELKNMGRIFKGVSDKYRLQILLILNKQPVCVCIIKELLGITDSKLSYHLNILKENDLIYGKQQGNWIIYHLTKLGKTIAKFMLQELY
jgi:ArsR family transcriptional regulator